jgi:hypothetical protein
MGGTPHDQVEAGYYWVKQTPKVFGWDLIVLFHVYFGEDIPYGYTAWAMHRDQIIKGTGIPPEWYIGPKINTRDFHEMEGKEYK